MISYWQMDTGVPSNDLAAVSFDATRESVYAGTRNSGLARLDLSDFSFAYWNQSSGLASDQVQTLLTDAASARVFIGTASGIQTLSIADGTLTNVCGSAGLSTYDLDLPVGSTTLYGATESGLLICNLADDTTQWVNSADGLPRDLVRSVYADSLRSRVYLAVTPGLSIYFENNGTLLNLNETHGLPSPIVNAIDAIPAGDYVFLATSANGGLSNGGLSILDATDFGFTNIGEQEGLTHAEVDDVSYDPARSRLYLSVRPGGPTSPAFPVHSVVDVVDLASYNVSSVTIAEGIPGGIIWDLEYDGQKDLILIAADEQFGELTGPVGGGIVVMDVSSPSMSDLTGATAERAQQVLISVEVVDPDGVASVEAAYIDVVGTSGILTLNRGAGDVYSAPLPGQDPEGIVSYRVTAADNLGRIRVTPSYSEWHEIAIQDTLPPAVVSFVPAGGSVPVDADIVLGFSERMDLATLQNSLAISPAVSMGQPLEEGTAVRFDLATLQYEATYSVVLAQTATDLYGNELDGDGDGQPGGEFRWSFTTAERPTPPSLQAIGPSSVETGQPIDIQAIVQDPDGVAYVSLNYTDVVGQDHVVAMTFLGSSGTGEIWTARIPGQPVPGMVTFAVHATDSKGSVAAYPLQGTLAVRVNPAPGAPDYLFWLGPLTVGLAAVGLAYYLGVLRRRRER